MQKECFQRFLEHKTPIVTHGPSVTFAKNQMIGKKKRNIVIPWNADESHFKNRHTVPRSRIHTRDRLGPGHPLGKRVSPQARLQRRWTRPHSIAGDGKALGLGDRRTGCQPPSTKNDHCDILPVPSLCQPSIPHPNLGEVGGDLWISKWLILLPKKWFGHFQGHFWLS